MLNNFALLVGVGADLPDTVTDAQGLAAILTDPSRCAFARERVVVLTAQNATRQRVLDELDHLAQAAADAASGAVIVYFSGHGCTAETAMGAGYFLMPYGYDVQQLAETAISGSEFARKLAAIQSQRLLLLLDCCHAGGLADAQAKVAGLRLAKAPLPPEAQTFFAQGGGRVLIASSQANELSFAGRPYSLFTRALLECLAGAGVAKQDGYVRALDLAMHARQMVPRWSNDKQHPIADIEHADNFVVAYYAAGATEPKALDLPPMDPAEVERLNAAMPLSQQFGDIDLRGSQGGIVGATGPITQTFGLQTNTFGPEVAGVGGSVIVANVGANAQNVVIGSHNRQTVTTNFGPQGATVEAFTALLAELRQGLAIANLAPDEQSSADDDLAVVAAQLARPEPRLSVIRAKLNSVKELVESVAGVGLAAGGLVQLLQRGVEMAQQLFR